jgi:UDP:flavonoid glycosyltransferase YjiC (YdhE family)
MVEDQPHSQEPLPKIAFLPCFRNFGETYPLIVMATKYRELGGDAIFIDYPGEYEHYARDQGFKVIELTKPPTKKPYEKLKRLEARFHDNLGPPEKVYPYLFRSGLEGDDRITQEIDLFTREGVDAAVASFNFSAFISARAANIPLITLISGVSTTAYFKEHRATFPDDYETPFTLLIPKTIKDRFINHYVLSCRWGVRWCNKLAKKYHTPRIHRFLDFFHGDETFIMDDPVFAGLQTTTANTHEHFIGPIIPDHAIMVKQPPPDPDVASLLAKPGRTVLLALGTMVAKKTFLEILKTLDQTEYKVIGSTKNFASHDELPPQRETILLRRFFPSMKALQERADLSVITGGRGAIYTAAVSGRPVVGIPMHAEQQWNLNNLMRHGVGIQISKTFFSGRKLLKAIDTIFADYDTYYTHAQHLKTRMHDTDIPAAAARRILEISQAHVRPRENSMK